MKNFRLLLMIFMLITGGSGFAHQYKFNLRPDKETGLIPPTNLTAEHLGLGVVELNWDFEPTEDFLFFYVYRDNERIGSTQDLFYQDTLQSVGVYSYKVTALYNEGESNPAGPVEVEWNVSPVIQVEPDEVYETHPCAPMETTKTLIVKNDGEVPLSWCFFIENDQALETSDLSLLKTDVSNKIVSSDKHSFPGVKAGNTLKVLHDVGISQIIQPSSGYSFSSTEPVIITIQNFGETSQSEIPYQVSWSGPTGTGSISGVCSDTLQQGEFTEIVIEETANLFLVGEYLFEACTQLPNDQNSNNDCITKSVLNNLDNLPFLSLYSTGCSFGDGLISWELQNISVPDIPCEGYPEFYNDYKAKIHFLIPGQTYLLTVTAGYSQTYFDVWINYDDSDYVFDDELILNDAYCANANQEYTFELIVPVDANTGLHTLRYRTNWVDPVLDCCELYSYGNCSDFSAYISNGDSWLETDYLFGTVPPLQTQEVTLLFNSMSLVEGNYLTTMLIQSDDPVKPMLEIPVQLEVLQSLQPPTNLTAEHLGLGVVELNWDFEPTEEFQYFRIYRNGSLIDSLTETSYLDSLPVFSIYTYEITAFYDEGESQPAGPLEIEWVALPIIEVSPMEIIETHPCAPMTTTQTLTISNVGEVPLDWELAFDPNEFFSKKTLHVVEKEKPHTENNNTTSKKSDTDVGVFMINQPHNNWSFSISEPIIITLKNFGNNTQTEIPYEVTWEGPTGIGSINGTFYGNLSSGDTVSTTLAETVNLYVDGQYLFEACTYLSNDENADNDCKTKEVYNMLSNILPWENLYSSGCGFGDGLISWNLKNVSVPEIPCEGTPEYYHDYKNEVHLLAPGETYMLTVIAGYSQTYFDVWINYNNDWFATNNELVLDDGYCPNANQEYTFEITIPDTVPPGFHILRYRTNWIDPVEHYFVTYSYGNCCDFTAYISDDVEWLEADTLSGILAPWQSQEVTLTFNSEGLDPGTYFTHLAIQNFDPFYPVVEIPVQLEVQEAEITYTWEPEYFEFEFFITKDPGIDYLTIENTGTETLDVDFEIEYLDLSEDEWLSISPVTANIPAGEEQIFEVSADPSYLYGYHGEANLIMNTSDVCFPSQTIPVTVDVIGAVEETGESGINIFPNPAGDLVNITAENTLDRIIVQNHFGQIVLEEEVHSASVQLDTSGLPGGVYFVTISKNGLRSAHKVIVH